MKGRAGVVVAALVLIGVLALAVFPAKAWLEQRRDLRALVAQEAALTAENQALQARTDQLRSDEEIERLAREQYGLVKPGEEAYAILPSPPPPTTVPPTAAKSSARAAPKSWPARFLHSLL